ncbi:MAG: hypothetical protein H3C48_03130 [Chitinophagaceae bacterium]|nr:hypothetical protein [Chitinophagaceae bacterium]
MLILLPVPDFIIAALLLKNGTLTIDIASSPLMLGNPTMAIPAVVYSLITLITAGIFISIVNQKRVRLTAA